MPSTTFSSVNCSFIWVQAFCTFWLVVDLMYKLLLWPFAETEVRSKMQVLVLGSGFQISAVSLLEGWQDCWFPDHGCKNVWDICDPGQPGCGIHWSPVELYTPLGLQSYGVDWELSLTSPLSFTSWFCKQKSASKHLAFQRKAICYSLGKASAFNKGKFPGTSAGLK